MRYQKGIIAFTVAVVMLTVCVIAAGISVKYFGKDNEIEEEAVDIGEDAVEITLHLPEGKLKPEANYIIKEMDEL